MSASNPTKKCGVKRKNHKCGIGLCNVDGEEKYEPPVKIADIEKQDDGEEKPKKAVQRRCRKCLMPLKSHPMPRGEGCLVVSKLTEDEQIGLLKKQQERKAEDDMVNKRKQRKQQSNEQINIERESARLGMASKANKEGTRQRLASAANKEGTRKRLASTANMEETRKRLASTANMEETRKRRASTANKEHVWRGGIRLH